MSCNIPVKNGVKQAADCKCYGAVMKVYGHMIEAGEPEMVALEAAKILYSFHHPEDSAQDAYLTVERWTSEGHVH